MGTVNTFAFIGSLGLDANLTCEFSDMGIEGSKGETKGRRLRYESGFKRRTFLAWNGSISRDPQSGISVQIGQFCFLVMNFSIDSLEQDEKSLELIEH